VTATGATIAVDGGFAAPFYMDGSYRAAIDLKP
jgi:hypothetical protein